MLDPTTASPAEQSTATPSSSSRRARAAPGQPPGHPMAHRPRSALGERQLEQGHRAVPTLGPPHPRLQDAARLRLTWSIAVAASSLSPQCGSAPGPRHARLCMRHRGGPRHGCCEHPLHWAPAAAFPKQGWCCAQPLRQQRRSCRLGGPGAHESGQSWSRGRTSPGPPPPLFNGGDSATCSAHFSGAVHTGE